MVQKAVEAVYRDGLAARNVAELVAANSGLGFRILKAQRFLATADVFAGIVLIGLLGLATDLTFKFLTARLVPWAKP